MSATQQIAEAFTAARAAGRALDAYPGTPPATLAEAYAIQAAAIARWPDAVKGWKVAREGTTRFDGALPVNPSGGLKARGHPIGATGVSQHVMAAMQLVGEAGDMQVKDASLAGVFNMGGAAVASYVSILERAR